MSDKELWDALSVIARRMGLLERGQRLEVVGDPRDEPVRDDALCLAFGKYGEVRLCCVNRRGHAGLHTWETAMVGKSACVSRSAFVTPPSATVHECQRPAGHSGEHKATGADGVRWTWGDAPRDLCGAKNAAENPVMAGQVCELPRGHEGSHEATVNGQRWLFGAHEPREQPEVAALDATRCTSTQPGSGMRCIRQAGHEGEHRKLMRQWSDSAPDPTTERA
jgi:hypothetical protein